MVCQCEVHIWFVLRTCCCGGVNVLEVAVQCHDVYVLVPYSSTMYCIPWCALMSELQHKVGCNDMSM